MEVEIISLNHNGAGLGKINNKIIFVPKTITGDKITVKNIQDHGNYYEGELDKIINKSEKRVIPQCKYYTECGGCHLMHMSYEDQLNYKKNKIQNIFKKYCNIEINPEIESSIQFEYRNKVTFQVKNGIIGFYKNGTNNLIEINKCMLINEEMNNILNIIKNNINLLNINQIIIKGETNNYMVIFYADKIIDIDITPLKNKVKSIFINDLCIYGDQIVTINLDDYKFKISKESFFQVNKDATSKLYNYIKNNIDKNSNNLLDLYCGVGSISIYCNQNSKNIKGVELNKQAIDNANTNKLINKIDNIEFICLNANKINYKKNDFDTIIVDPPRGGLDKKTINILKEIESNQIIYVSCNPITLARDINRLKDKYELKDLKLFDLFPNTYHVECCSVLCLKEDQKAHKIKDFKRFKKI